MPNVVTFRYINRVTDIPPPPPPPTSQEDPDISPRLRFRQARQRRQNLAFSIITITMAVAGILSILVLSSLVKIPFFSEFEASEDHAESGDVPCLPKDAVAADLEGIVVKVLNATGSPGLAGTIGDRLAAHGVKLEEPGNYVGQFYGTVRINAGASQVVNAYTLQRFFPDSTVRFTQADSEIITIVLGDHFEAMMPEEDMAKLIESGNNTLTAPSECKPAPPVKKK